MGDCLQSIASRIVMPLLRTFCSNANSMTLSTWLNSNVVEDK